MTYRDFCYWLDGYLKFEPIHGLMYYSSRLVDIKNKLDKVINEEELKTRTVVDLKGTEWPKSTPQDFYDK